MYFIKVKFSFVAFHYWYTAPPEFAYLSKPHRHEFFVDVEMVVLHRDRAVEINQLAKELAAYCRASWPEDLNHATTFSCEELAETIANAARSFVASNYIKVTVLEDGLQGGGYIYDTR